MDEITCPNCNVDVSIQELRQNHLICPTCGHDWSDSAELDPDSEGEFDEEDE
jgi:Zn-finger nucleic acid-binding protein